MISMNTLCMMVLFFQAEKQKSNPANNSDLLCDIGFGSSGNTNRQNSTQLQEFGDFTAAFSNVSQENKTVINNNTGSGSINTINNNNNSNK